jgi:tight adherence protein B
MSLTHIFAFVAVFSVMLGIVELIPGIFNAYRDRYNASSRRTARELDKFFLTIKPTRVLIGSIVLGIFLGYYAGSWIIAAVIASAGIFAPRILLSIWKGIRSEQFDAQLMDALILISNSLKSGLDIVAGIERVAGTMKPPISEEFGLVMNAYRLGAPLEAALIDLTTRINSRTLETVVYAISIQRETGGNIIKTFDQLVATIREEGKLQKKVAAITSQGRTQIYFLAGFPWVLAIIFYFLSPDMMQPALASTPGQLVLVFLVIWEIIGIMVTKKVVTVDV